MGWREWTTQRGNRAVLIAAAITVVGVSTITAHAATLQDSGAENLGTNTSIVAPCDNSGFDVGWDGFSPMSGTGQYAFNIVTFRDVASECNGKQYSITVAKSNFDAINASSGILAVDNGVAEITLTGTGSPVPVSDAAYVSVLVAGP